VASFAIGKFVTIGAGAVTVIASINKALAATAGMSAWGAIVANITKVGTAVKGLYVLLMANPIYAVAAAVAALTAAWAAYVYATGIVVSTDEKRSNELQTLRAEREELGQTLRALRKYSEAQKLNGDEQTNAKKIIEELTSRYGDLGLSIDAATGKLVGYADAQKKISEIEKQKELDAIKGAIAEKKRNININNSNLDELGSDWFEYNSEEKAENLRRQMEKDQAELRELTQRYIDIQNQTVDVMPSDRTAQDDFEAKEAAAARRQAALDKRNENYKSYAEKKKALDRELMDEEGRAIDDVEEKYKEFFGNLHAMWSDAIRNMDFGEAAKIVEEMKQSRINAEKEIERIRKDAADKRKREAEEEKRKQVELEEQAEKNLQFEYEMYKEIAELKGDVKGAEALQNEIDRIGFERDLIDRFGENEEAKASARGLNAQLIAARKLGAVQSTSAGTFNAAAINAISGGSVQDRIAKATEETAKGVKKLNDKRGGIFVK
jgi:hypothetical protein